MNLQTVRGVLAGMGLGVLALWSGAAAAGQIEALKAHVPDKVDFDAAKNTALRKIVILHINPTHHFVVENSGVLTAAFGGILEHAFEDDANSKHATQYLELMKTKSVNFIPPLVDALQKELQAVGYEVSYTQQGPRLKDDKKTLDYANIKTDADALMTVWYGKTGYWSPTSKPSYGPQIIMGVKLTDAHTFETLFFKTFDVTQVAGQVTNDNVEAIAPDPKYLFANWDDLIAKFDDSVSGLHDSEGLIAAHVAQRLKPAAAGQ